MPLRYSGYKNRRDSLFTITDAVIDADRRAIVNYSIGKQVAQGKNTERKETMLEQAGTMFDNMEMMLYRIKKKVYKERMEQFREKNQEILAEMTGFVEQGSNREAAAAQVAEALADAVESRFAKRGKISGRSQMDINLFMIYYVFPAILMTQSECAVPLADAIRDEWRGRFRDSAQLQYATFEELSSTFQEKFLGLF